MNLYHFCLTLLLCLRLDGAPFEGFTFETQFEKRAILPDDLRVAVISYDKASSAWVNTFLQQQTPLYLYERRAVFIADITPMPALITTLFALPALQKFRHTIHLVRDEAFARTYPPHEGAVTVRFFEAGVPVRTGYVRNAAQLQRQLGAK